MTDPTVAFFFFQGYTFRAIAASGDRIMFDAGYRSNSGNVAASPIVINGIPYRVRFDAVRADNGSWDVEYVPDRPASSPLPLVYMRRSNPYSSVEPTNAAWRKARELSQRVSHTFPYTVAAEEILYAGEQKAARLELASAKRALESAHKSLIDAGMRYVRAEIRLLDSGLELEEEIE